MKMKEKYVNNTRDPFRSYEYIHFKRDCREAWRDTNKTQQASGSYTKSALLLFNEGRPCFSARSSLPQVNSGKGYGSLTKWLASRSSFACVYILLIVCPVTRLCGLLSDKSILKSQIEENEPCSEGAEEPFRRL
jgi:hypothetical protein